jgi:arylformamidase
VSRRLVDLSHEIEDGMVTYPGLPAPKIRDWLSRDKSTDRYAPGTTFQMGMIELLANTGTYIDAPWHRYEEGKDVAGYALDAVADLPGVLVTATVRGRAIEAGAFAGIDARGKAVLVRTGWDRHWRTEQYGRGHPFLTAAAARWLVDAGAALVGIDSLNIDDDTDGTRPVHSTLLGAGVAIVEHMRGLDQVPRDGFRFFAVPPKVKGIGSFPVRAFALVGG